MGFYKDDFSYLHAPALRSIGDLPAVFAFAGKLITRSLSQGLYYSIGIGIWGFDPKKWHTANMVIFAIDVLLLYALVQRLTRRRASALIGAGIFAFSGALFIAQAWVAASNELLGVTFVFAALLAHSHAIDRKATRLQKWMDLPAIIFVVAALFSKENTLPLTLIFPLLDLFALRKLTPVGWIVLSMGFGGVIAGLPLLHIKMMSSPHYAVSVNPLKIAANLLVLFYDPIIATGGDYLILNRIGMTKGNESGILDIIELAKLHPYVSGTIVVGAIGLALGWIRLTIAWARMEHVEDPVNEPMVMPSFGWVAWFIMLIPAMMIPEHHYPYYVAMPLGLLMVAVGPAIDYGLRHYEYHNIVIAALILYLCWFPINSNVAFNLSTVSRGAVIAENLRKEVMEVLPEAKPGTVVMLDGLDDDMMRALSSGAALEIWYPGVRGRAFKDLRQQILEKRPKIQPGTRIVVLGLKDNEVRNVTADFAYLF
jgi:hypothetical protein